LALNLVNHNKYSVFTGLCSSQKHKVEASTPRGPGIELASAKVCEAATPLAAEVSDGLTVIADCRLQIADFRFKISDCEF
jgi:hypothetical protein